MIETLEPSEVVEASNGDMYARVALATGGVTGGAWFSDGAVIWANTYRSTPSLAGVGPPRAVADLAAAVAVEVPDATRASLPRGWTGLLPSSLRTAEPSEDWKSVV